MDHEHAFLKIKKAGSEPSMMIAVVNENGIQTE